MTQTTDQGRRTADALEAGAGAPPGERIAKMMARAGLCSRRDAESWIKAGRVAVNGRVITSPALNVSPEDCISVDGTPIEARERTRLFLYHKPRGLVTTAKDPEGRPTVFDNLPEGLPRVVSVGRLDINTEGLLLLTNDGGLARMLELPTTGWLRRYRVRANGHVDPAALDALKDGITIEGVDYAGIEAVLDRTQGANTWLSIGLREGKNREIKRVLEHLGLYVNRLIRLSFGPFQLGELAEGEAEEVRTRVLRDQLGEALAREAGVDWEGITAPVVTREVAQAAKPDGPRRKPDRGHDRAAAPEPRRDRPAPRARPHVSAIRAERPRADDEPRKTIARSETADRKGRAVAVERISVEKKGRHLGEGGTSRNARRFATERDPDERGPRPDRRTRRGAAAQLEPASGKPGRLSRRGTGPQPSSDKPGRSPRGFGSDRPATGRALKDAKTRSGRSANAKPSGGGGRPTPTGKPPRPGRPDRNGPRGRG